MAIRRASAPTTTDIDMTPMIDVTFQLITFFLFIMNFSEAEQDDRIQLPLSQLAKPVEGLIEKPITLQLTNSGNVIYAGELVAVRDIGSYLEREKMAMRDSGREPNAATVIVRADGRAQAGEVQDIIRICQDKGFERFALRAQYDEGR